THGDKFHSRSLPRWYIIFPVIFHLVTLHGVPVMPSMRSFLVLAGILVLASNSYGQAGGAEAERKAKAEDEKAAEAKSKAQEDKAAEPVSPSAVDEQLLKGAHLEVNSAALLEFVRKRIPGEVKRDQVEGLIRQLGDKKPEVRDKSAGELVRLGVAAVPLLHARARDLDDVELSGRAKQCLDAIHNSALVAAAARLLAERNPEGTSE